LAWLLAKPFVTSVILGAKRLEQLEDNLQALNVTLLPDELQQLDDASELPPEYPGWMMEVQTAGRLAEPGTNMWGKVQTS
jgi:diketogulonate reductase-like aldo/keto reductase